MAVNERESIVWILGAGFSRSLGAPLLSDLFQRGVCGFDQHVPLPRN